MLRPGNANGADGWRDVLEPVVALYRERDLRRYFRGDVAIAMRITDNCLKKFFI